VESQHAFIKVDLNSNVHGDISRLGSRYPVRPYYILNDGVEFGPVADTGQNVKRAPASDKFHTAQLNAPPFEHRALRALRCSNILHGSSARGSRRTSGGFVVFSAGESTIPRIKGSFRSNHIGEVREISEDRSGGRHP
jgi:hypothetical protein